MESMTSKTREILEQALQLPAAEKARLVDQILASLDRPDPAVDDLWRKEVQDRIRAHAAGELQSVPLQQVLEKYRK
jgi:putative addiction module component (TIGR02574 family)